MDDINTSGQLQHAVTQLLIMRGEIVKQIEELLLILRSDGLLQEAALSELLEAWSSLVRSQAKALDLIPLSYTKPDTITDLNRISEELIIAAQQSLKVESSRKAIHLFTMLKCSDEEAAYEFVRHQADAERLLHELSDAELSDAGEPYEIVIRLIEDPEALIDRSDMYKRITRSIGYATRDALEKGWLTLQGDSTNEVFDVVSKPSTACEESSRGKVAARQSTAAGLEEAASIEAVIDNLQPADINREEILLTDTLQAPSSTELNELADNSRNLSCGVDFSIIEYELLDKKKRADNFSVNKFEGDMKQVSFKTSLPAYILSYLYNNGLSADSELNLWVGKPDDASGQSSEDLENNAREALKKLYQKGYVAIHTITVPGQSDTFYTLSDYGAAAFRKDTSRKFIQTRVSMKLILKVEEAPLVLNVDQPAAAAFRMRMLNRSLQVLHNSLTMRLSLGRTMMPFPYRELSDKQTGNRYLFIPGLIDAARPEADDRLIADIVNNHADLLPVIVVETPDEGRRWAERLSDSVRPAYFFAMENESPIVGDRDGNNLLYSLFEVEEENPDESLAFESDASDISNTSDASGTSNVSEPAPSEGITQRADLLKVDGDGGATPDAGRPDAASAAAKSGAGILSEPLQTAPLPQAQQVDEASISIEDLQRIVVTALEMLAADRHAEGMLLLHEAAEYSMDAEVLRDKVSFILGDPLCTKEDGHSLADLPVNLPFGDCEALDDFLNAAIWLRIFFEPEDPNDYRLNSRWKQINSDLSSRVLEHFPGLKQLISYFWTSIDRNHIAIKYCASSDVRDQLGINQALEQCRQRIDEMLKTEFPRNTKIEFNHPKVKQMAVELYGNNGVMTKFLKTAPDLSLQELQDICQPFTETNLSADLDSLELHPHDGKLESFLDRHWADMSVSIKTFSEKSTTLTGAYRGKMRNKLREAAEPLLKCYACRSALAESRGTTEISPETAFKTRSRAVELMLEAMRQLDEPPVAVHDTGRRLIQSMIRHFQAVLGDAPAEQEIRFYESLLLSGNIELDADYLPVRDEQWLGGAVPVAEYRLWRRLLHHCSLPARTWEDTGYQALRHYNMTMYKSIARRPGEWPSEATVEDTQRKAAQLLEKYIEEFRTSVELAQNYGQIASNDEMYGYIKLAEAAKKHAEKTLNVGFFNGLLESCRKQIIHNSDTRMVATRSRLEALKRDICQSLDRDDQASDEEVLKQWPILDKIELSLQRRNMTVAEDYLDLAEKGDKDTPTIQMFDNDLYKTFLDRYQSLFNSCNAHKGEDLFRTYNQAVRNMLFPNQQNRNTDNAEKFIKLWYKLQPHQIKEFMEQLLFHKVERAPEKIRDNEYLVYPAPHDAEQGYYPHPFKVFGTDAAHKGVRVLTMAGVRTPDNLLDEVAQRGSGNWSATVVVLDYALPLADRRLLSKSIKLRSLPEIIVIDRVMALFLAGYSQIERGNAFLMVALPSSKVQPYIPVGGIPPEMFIGRTDDLEKIRNLNGPIFVYGGRQLGKTALLRETKNREHDPKKGRFAIFVDLRNKDEGDSLRSIGEALVDEGLLAQPCDSWADLRVALRGKLSAGDKPIHKLMLLLDEADVFIASCEANQNRPLEILKELKDSFNGQFKFVIAGLRNVVRFNKQRLGGNSVLAHLGHITIRPLKYLEARDLLLRPLQYLGFRIEAGGEDIINLILAKTNYYPGLIHFYCQKLIEAIADSYRNGNYNESDHPPYWLNERHIKTLLGEKEFLSNIEEKFRITLELDTENMYDILAKAIAYRYYEVGIGKGVSAQDIIRICRDFEIGKIADLPENSVKALLEEMDELNILRREAQDSENYVFNRYSFFQMLGSCIEDLFDQLCELGEN